MKALQNLITATALAAAMVVASPLALAHATLLGTSPEAGATLAAAPKQIALTFNEKVAGPFSSITLADSAGKPVATAKASVDAANPAVLQLALPALPAGAYSVKWAVAGHDGHRRQGEFTFTVK
jgi:methionine-rich copper-binding protein CopC